MTQTFTLTPNDVVRYLYNETSDKENTLIIEALLQDTDLLAFYLDSVDLKNGLDNAVLSPPTHVVNSILTFSERYMSEC